MFRDIKNQMRSHVVRQILAACVFDDSPEGLDKLADDYHRHGDWQLFGWFDREILLGVCGFEVHSDWVEILHIATSENARGHGVGRAIIAELQNIYKMTIEAETDDDAVVFYRKCGFETTAIRKYDMQRWTCVLHLNYVR